MKQNRNEDRKPKGSNLVFLIGTFLFVFSAIYFFESLQWLLLITQKGAQHTLLTPEIVRHLKKLVILEQQIPFFHFWLWYGLVFNSALIIVTCGLLKFRETSRKAVQILLGLDALLFLCLVIYYLLIGHEPRISERFHARFLFTVGRILLLMFLGSPTFMKAFTTGQRKLNSRNA